MKHSLNSTVGLAILAGFTLPVSAASSIGGGFIDYVTVGNPGNAADTTGYGAVAYEYKIAKNETTIGQYAEFLNAAAKSDPYHLSTRSWRATPILRGFCGVAATGVTRMLLWQAASTSPSPT